MVIQNQYIKNRLLIGLLFFYLFLNVKVYTQDHDGSGLSDNRSKVKLENKTRESLIAADSLYRAATNENEKVNALLAYAQIYQRLGRHEEAVVKGKEAYRIAEKNKMIEWQVKTLGFLSVEYKELGLVEQGKESLEKALALSKETTDKDDLLTFSGAIYREKSNWETREGNYEEAIGLLKQSIHFFEQLPLNKNRNFLIAMDMESIATNYLHLKKHDSALYFYNSGLDYLLNSQSKESPLKGFLYKGIADVYMAQDNDEPAFSFYKQALAIADESGYYTLKIDTYKGLMEYYKKNRNQQDYVHYNEKLLYLTDSLDKAKSLATNDIIKEIKQNEELAVSKQRLFLILGIISVLLSLLLIYYYKVKQEKEYVRFQNIIKILEEKKQEKDNHKVLEPEASSVEDDEVVESQKVLNVAATRQEMMSVEAEKKLLDKLTVFESSVKFLDKTISLSMLSVELETNNRYLSYVINKHKQTDFYGYINRLRIDYIIRKLHDDPAYSNYKISYLAEECGFSSHAKFTTVFKKIMEMSPSTFLSLLEKRRKE